MSRILIVEDEPAIAELIAINLRHAGFEVTIAGDAEQAQAALDQVLPHLVILDWMLPGTSGHSLARQWRAAPRTRELPIIMLTARAEEADKVSGLDAGADDYLTKPFALAELEARIRALIRRSHGHDQNVLVNGPLAFDTAARTATVSGCNVELSSRELAVLELLLMRCGRVIAKEQFVEHLCGWDQDVTANAIEVYVHRLRRKLEPAGVQVQTVRGLGYYLTKA